MKSFRTNVFKTAVKFTKRRRKLVNEHNLQKKRRDLDRLEKYFPVYKHADVRVLSMKGFKGEWIVTPKARPDKVMLYIHGGGFVFYPKLYRDMIGRLAAATETKIFSLDYSLSPEHKYPKALNEALAAYKWLLKSYKPTDIILAGDSAGGSLTLSLLHELINKKLPNPCAAVVISPATDATLSGNSMKRNKAKDFFISQEALTYFIDAYFGDTARDHPIASPLHGSFEGFPPLLIHVDKGEIMYDDSARVYDKARKAGVNAQLYETEGMWHVHHLYARYVPDARRAIQHVADFVKEKLAI